MYWFTRSTPRVEETADPPPCPSLGRGVVSCADRGIDRIDDKDNIYIMCFVFIMNIVLFTVSSLVR
jgi:hypothetical protein